ncbi:short-chain dehydrogenase [Weissella oryzae SG25]|uniref:Short-chain dehydrogenase n=1 Tax=Weissella oryzae (strain DSM 25784 / JCM 18191 / LMG 30913 / SG25) TaxID=1329250 RepID=A0A069D0V3_WEIOS|nr:oxidoreductase [Weissella oryzae]GAK30966.1 short-chain dehydrogenase [Weissella oryzae SG25]
MNKQVALVTGASSGIGKATALALNSAGYTVYGLARRVNLMDDLALAGVKVLAMDVTDHAAMVTVVTKVLADEGRIDVLINNAGYGSYGAVEDVPIEEARRQLDVNLFGLADLTKLVLPTMRAQHTGKIINLSSMAGRVWTPFGAWYHASKFALEGFSNALRLELAPFGIKVVLIEPGAIKTQWGIIAADNFEKASAKGPYAQAAQQKATNLRSLYQNKALTAPTVIARIILKAVSAKRPRTRYLIGYGAWPAVLIQKFLGDRIFDWLIQRIM